MTAPGSPPDRFPLAAMLHALELSALALRASAEATLALVDAIRGPQAPVAPAAQPAQPPPSVDAAAAMGTGIADGPAGTMAATPASDEPRRLDPRIAHATAPPIFSRKHHTPDDAGAPALD